MLTTQYMEEADQLADDVVVIDHGCAIARGSSDDLKAMIGGERVEVSVASPHDADTVHQVLNEHSSGEVHRDARTLTAPVSGGAETLGAILRALDARVRGAVCVRLRRLDRDSRRVVP